MTNPRQIIIDTLATGGSLTYDRRSEFIITELEKAGFEIISTEKLNKMVEEARHCHNFSAELYRRLLPVQAELNKIMNIKVEDG